MLAVGWKYVVDFGWFYWIVVILRFDVNKCCRFCLEFVVMNLGLFGLGFICYLP